ncbi:MAG TPA: M1 family aminopeptidase [Blastocatellia bacterium]|nr:M1 family aminopeptidase [Blastocatellia bacterium]
MNQPRFELLKSARALVLAFALALSSLSSFAQAPAPATSPEAPPYQWPRSHDYDVQHYRIAVSFDWAKQSVAGETTITLKPFKGGVKEIEIDAGDMTINSVKLAGGGPLKFRHENNEKLYVALDRAYAPGADVSIAINYKATPGKGLVFITPTEDDPTRPHQIWSQGESQDNHYWFPCYDYPNDKATTELIATVDQNYQVISNGVLVSSQLDPAKKTRTFHWKMDKPYSSYLASIIVGEFALVKDQYKNVPIESYVYAGEVENARISFGKIGQMMSFFSERIGFDFPYARYAQTTVRDFGGGMENITATTLQDTIVHDKRAHLDISSDGLIAHELAHSWFGDMLTCRDWGELWLNESFATFMEAVWAEHDKGRDEYLYEMLGNQQAYYQAWAQGNHRPIVTKRYHDPDSLFDVYPYPRGAAVLNMLRFVLGEESFWKAVNHYVKKHQWQNVETQQLVIAIEEATGQNLQWFFDEWVYKMGHPEFEITSSFDESARSVKLTVKQAQKPDLARAWFSSPEFFTMPVDVGITTASGEKVHRVWIDRPENDFTFAVDSKPLTIEFDKGNYLIKQVSFKRGDDELAYQLLHDKDAIGRVIAATELKSRGGEAATKALRDAALKDAFWGVRIEAVKALAQFKTEASRNALVEAAKDKDSRIRREAIKGLAAFNDPKLADLYIGVINSDPSYFAIAEAATALGQSGATKAFEVLSDALKMESWQGTIRAGVLAGLAALKDPRSFEIGLKYAAPSNPDNLRASAFQVIATTGKGNDRAFEALVNVLKEKSPQARLFAIQALGTLGDARAIPALEEAAKSQNFPGPFKQVVDAVIVLIKNRNK